MVLLTLDKSGVLMALLFGLLILFFGRGTGFFFVLVIIGFLVLSAIVTNIGRKTKRKLKTYKDNRNWINVTANGIVPVIVSLFFFFSSASSTRYVDFMVIAYVASVAAITADKFGSELGILDGEPVMLLTLKMVKKGTSGGVSFSGLLYGVIASVIISSSLFLAGFSAAAFLISSLSGFSGSIVDSIFGYFEEKGVGNKFTSNVACSLAGFIMAFLLALFLGISR